MKNRDTFLDLVEEIDVRHLDRHYRRNTETKKKKIMRYVTAAGIYAAACLVLVLLVPFIIGQTDLVPPTDDPIVPGNAEMTVEEAYADTKLFRVLKALDISYKDVDSLTVDDYQICGGTVYYLKDNAIYRDLEEAPVMKSDLEIDSFLVDSNWAYKVYYTAWEETDSLRTRTLRCYDPSLEENNDTVVCADHVLGYTTVDKELVYVTAPTDDVMELAVYAYSLSGKTELICRAPVEQGSTGEIYCNGYVIAVTTDESDLSSGATAYNMYHEEWSTLFDPRGWARMSIEGADEGYYLSVQRLGKDDSKGIVNLESDRNGVWYGNWDTGEQEKITDTSYEELYYVNGALAGVNGDEITVVVEKPSPEEIYDLEEGMLFPRPETIFVSCKYDTRQFTPGDSFYQYLYERMNERVPEGGTEEMPDCDFGYPAEYAANDDMYVQFSYSGDKLGAPIYLDKNNPDEASTPYTLLFPLSGKATNGVIVQHTITNEEDGTSEFIKKCYGVLAHDQELIDAIWDFFSYASPELTDEEKASDIPQLIDTIVEKQYTSATKKSGVPGFMEYTMLRSLPIPDRYKHVERFIEYKDQVHDAISEALDERTDIRILTWQVGDKAEDVPYIVRCVIPDGSSVDDDKCDEFMAYLDKKLEAKLSGGSADNAAEFDSLGTVLLDISNGEWVYFDTASGTFQRIELYEDYFKVYDMFRNIPDVGLPAHVDEVADK